MGNTTIFLAGQYRFNDGEGTGSAECNAGLRAIETLTETLHEEGHSVTTVTSQRDRPDAWFSDRNAHRVSTNFATLSGADAAQLDAEPELVACPSEDGETIHYGPLEFRRGQTVRITAGSCQHRHELCNRLRKVDGLQDVDFVASDPARDEFALGILQCVIFYAMQHAIIDGEIFVCALGKTTHFAFWAKNLWEAIAFWHRAAHDTMQLAAPSRSRLLITFKHGEDPVDYVQTYGPELAHDIGQVRFLPWSVDDGAL
jgi:hypothetical protein